MVTDETVIDRDEQRPAVCRRPLHDLEEATEFDGPKASCARRDTRHHIDGTCKGR